MIPDRCQQPGCAGTVESGYCEVCGFAAKPAAEQSPERKPSAASATAMGSSPISRSTRGSRSSRRGSSASKRKPLGADLVDLPELPSTDPERAVMADAVVSENKRYCPHCDRKLAREKGYCGNCGQRFCFVPTLHAGDLVAGHYEVKGAIAFGGLGWIYLAFDRLLSRYVVLKGLLNTEDPAAAAVAVAERQFLAAVRHPNIVGIYSFVQLEAEGFIVMEYVGGETLRDIRRRRGPLPPTEAIAYIHRILGAFAYLHRLGMVYCDFKPENVMLEADDVKLIDLGGVRRIGDTKGDIYGTVGYSAPEANETPTVESDLFTVGRTLAVLLMDISGFGTDHRYTLPSVQDAPVLEQWESLHRFLLKATAYNPHDRFESAEEMAEQLLGVLREIVAVESGAPRPSASMLFTGDLLASRPPKGFHPIEPDFRHLPLPLIDGSDPAWNRVRDAAALPTTGARVTALREIAAVEPDSLEAKLQLAHSFIDSGHEHEAAALIGRMEASDPWNWRASWARGKLLLASRKPLEAQKIFDQIYFDLPGEPAPKLAFAMAAELTGNLAVAKSLYDRVLRTDPNYPSAAFGLARCSAETHDRAGSAEALGRISVDSHFHVFAQLESARALVRNGRSLPSLEDLERASAILEESPIDGSERHGLAVQLFTVCLKLLRTRKIKPVSSVRLLGFPVTEVYLRQGLEKSLRASARLSSPEESVRLIDEANKVRPRTLF